MKKYFIFAIGIISILVFSLIIIGCTTGGGGGGGGGAQYDPDAIIITEDITTPTTWASDKVYVVEGYIKVISTLVIPAGTIIKFAPESGMETLTNGVINASAGTELLPIIFTSVKDDSHGGDTNMDGTASSPAKKDWYDITITRNGSSFNYCHFYYGGGYYDYTLGFSDDISGSVTNCVFAHNDGATYGALYLGNVYDTTAVTGNRFYHNVIPLMMGTVLNIGDSNYFSNVEGTVFNTKNGIFLEAEYTSDLTPALTWNETEVPFVVMTKLVVKEGTSLTINPGVIVKLKPGAFIEALGTLVADGTNTSHITFTSYKDDSIGGDTNGDSVSTPLKKDWAEITVTGNGCIFNYCDFFYGGGGYDYTLGIYDVAGTVTNCVFAHNDGTTYGALDLGGAPASTVVTGNRFYDNVIPLQINTTFDVDDSNYFSNVGGAIKNTKNGIFVLGEVVDEVDISWSETEVAFVIKTFLRIENTGSLTLGNDVVLKFFGTYIHSLEWNGSNMNNYNGSGVAYTSYKDDTRKGDTNGDGASTGADGDWDGVYNRSETPPYPNYESWPGYIFYDSH